MMDMELKRLFAEVWEIGRAIKTTTQRDSIVMSCCSQFQLAFDRVGVDQVRRLCDRIDENLHGHGYPKSTVRYLVTQIRARIKYVDDQWSPS